MEKAHCAGFRPQHLIFDHFNAGSRPFYICILCRSPKFSTLIRWSKKDYFSTTIYIKFICWSKYKNTGINVELLDHQILLIKINKKPIKKMWSKTKYYTVL